MKVPLQGDQVEQKLENWGGSQYDSPEKRRQAAQALVEGRDQHVPLLLSLAEDNPLLARSLANPEALPKGVFLQDKVLPLKEVFGRIPTDQGKRIVDSYIKLIKLHWKHGFSESIFNIGANNGLSRDGTVVLVDFGEVTSELREAGADVREKKWNKGAAFTSMSDDLYTYYLERMDAELTEEALDELWESDIKKGPRSEATPLPQPQDSALDDLLDDEGYKYTAEVGGIPGGEMRRLSPDEKKDIVRRAEIHGTPLDAEITPQLLEELGLQPEVSFKLDGTQVTYSFSQIYTAERRQALVAYIDDGEKVVARSYYMSNSQGVWRNLPGYLVEDGRMVWYSKARGEHGLTLPAYVQKVIADTVGKEPVAQIQAGDQVLGGLAKDLARRKDMTIIKETEENPAPVTFLEQTPEKVRLLSPELEPDYSKLMTTWELDNTRYGQVTYEVYPSADDSLLFTVCRDEQGRIWFGSIEASHSQVSSVGLKRTWIDADNLATPLYEYSDHDKGYGDYDDRMGHYVGMFRNYLSKIPAIQRYYAETGREMPV